MALDHGDIPLQPSRRDRGSRAAEQSTGERHGAGAARATGWRDVLRLTRLKAARQFARISTVLRALTDPAARSIQKVMAPPLRVVERFWTWIEPWAVSQPLWRFATRSIYRRIVTANLVGFSVLSVGFMVLNQSNRWMIDARVESLTTQARLIGVAIAANAKVDLGGLTLDPDRLPEDGAGRPSPRDDVLSTIELSIAPERVAPILGRLIPVGDVRARIYRSDGFLIVDSNQRIVRGQIGRGAPGQTPPQTEPNERLKSAWTRFYAMFARSDLPVYREIGTTNGKVYPEVARALDGHSGTRMLLLNAASQQIVSVAVPILHLGAVQGVVQLSSRPGEIDELVRRQQRVVIMLSLMALLASLLASWMLGRTIAGPMRRLSLAADRVSHNINAERELPDFPGRRDEVGHMATAFREMTASLYRRIEASDRFAQDVAHELKNPVAAARSTAESLVYAKTEQKRAELVQHIQDEMKRLNRLITDVAKASRLDRELALQETAPVDMGTLAGGIAAVLGDVHSERGVAIRLELVPYPGSPAPYVVNGHEGRLGQVLTNLIDNAVSFSPRGGVVGVRVERFGEKVLVIIDDEGPGIPPDRLEHIFDRFYSDRPQSDQKAGKNSGLGLSISREIVRAHDGHVRAENRPAPGGVVVDDKLPPELKERRIAGVCGARLIVELPALVVAGARRDL